MMRGRYILALVLCALAAVRLAAQSTDNVLPFVAMDRDPVNAALAGAASSAVSGADLSYAAFGNPAAVPFMDRHFAIGVNYAMWAPSVWKDHVVNAGGAFKIGKWFGLTVGFARDMHAEEIYNGKPFKPYDMVIGGGLAFSIARCVGIGVNIKYAQQQMMSDYRLWGVSMDAFLQYHGKDFNVMAGVSNFGPKAQSTVVPTKYALVPVARLSGDYVARVGIVHLQPALSAEFAFNREWAVAAGFQLGIRDIGWLRAGYRYASAGSVMPSHLSLGAGATFYGVRLSATFLTANKEIGNTFLIGLGYSF